MSFFVGSYMWSQSDQFSACVAGNSVVCGLAMKFNRNRISGSQAATSTIGGVFQSPNHLFNMQMLTHCFILYFPFVALNLFT
jgi:hypothetical protein